MITNIIISIRLNGTIYATENNKIEFKKFSFPDGKITPEQKEKLEKEIAAFANADGGTIYIGIDESKEKVASQVIGRPVSYPTISAGASRSWPLCRTASTTARTRKRPWTGP